MKHLLALGQACTEKIFTYETMEFYNTSEAEVDVQIDRPLMKQDREVNQGKIMSVKARFSFKRDENMLSLEFFLR